MLNTDLVTPILQNQLGSVDSIIAVYLFGSVAQNKAHRQSDVDVAVLFQTDTDRQTLFDQTALVGSLLEAQFIWTVDVVALNLAPIFLQFQIIKYGKLVLEKDRTQRCLFHMRVLNRYYDAKPFLEYQQQALIQRIQEKGVGNGYQGYNNTLEKARRLRASLASTAESFSR